MKDLLQEIWATTRRNKLRTALTGFAVAWGIFMLICLLGAGNGLINAMRQNSGNFLDRSMVIFPGQTSKAYDGLTENRTITLNNKDVQTTAQQFGQQVDSAAARLQVYNDTLSVGVNNVVTTINGVYPIEQKINRQQLAQGRFINEMDCNERRRVLVITQEAARQLYEKEEGTVGKHLKMGNSDFLVVGVIKDDKSGFSNAAYMPFTTMQTLYNKGDKVDQIYFTFHGLESKEENEQFQKQYTAAINANHRAAPDDDAAIYIWNRFVSAMQMDNGVSIINTALWIIGIFTLLSGVVGVSNIMLITVRERTHEFGIRKALGATPWSLLRLIIVESVVLTTFFGYIGMVAGLAANAWMDASLANQTIDTGIFQVTMFINPTVGLSVCLQATAVMVIAGTLAGLIPARRAARTRPIEALRVQ